MLCNSPKESPRQAWYPLGQIRARNKSRALKVVDSRGRAKHTFVLEAVEQKLLLFGHNIKGCFISVNILSKIVQCYKNIPILFFLL